MPVSPVANTIPDGGLRDLGEHVGQPEIIEGGESRRRGQCVRPSCRAGGIGEQGDVGALQVRPSTPPFPP